jgi:F-type H+-transporting ATPase subunit b
LLTHIAPLVLVAEAVNDKKDLYPHWNELIMGAIAFAILFFFTAKFVLPRIGKLLDERRDKIQGDLEKAEETRRQAESELADYRAQLANAREESNAIIDEARKTAEQLRIDLQQRAEQDAQNIVARAQDEIRAERDRVFQELRAQVAEIAVELAGRVVGASLDPAAHALLIDRYIDEVAASAAGDSKSNGNGQH